MKKITLSFTLSLLLSFVVIGQPKMQASLKANTSNYSTLDIYLKSSQSFTNKDESMTLVIAIPATVAPGPSIGTTSVTTNSTGVVSGITGLIPTFLTNNLGATQRQVQTNVQNINSSSYYIYTFVFSGTAASDHVWVANVEQLIFSIQFNGCISNCNSTSQLIVNLPIGGSASNAYFYFQSNIIGDITNYQTPFYLNSQTGSVILNGNSSDGSALSYIGLTTPVSLPISLLNFAGSKEAVGNVLRWTTISEQNNKGFEVQRSTDGTNFSSISFVTSKADNGFSNHSISYSHVDDKLSASVYYYRLRQIDLDNRSNLSNTILIKGERTNTIKLSSLFPNPATEEVTVTIDAPNTDEVILVVTDIYGKQVMRKNISVVIGTNNAKLNISKLAASTYIIKANSAVTKNSSEIKLVKM